jgi:hypothetical protein
MGFVRSSRQLPFTLIGRALIVDHSFLAQMDETAGIAWNTTRHFAPIEDAEALVETKVARLGHSHDSSS